MPPLGRVQFGQIVRAALETLRGKLLGRAPLQQAHDEYRAYIDAATEQLERSRVAAIDPAREGGASTGITLNIGERLVVVGGGGGGGGTGGGGAIGTGTRAEPESAASTS